MRVDRGQEGLRICSGQRPWALKSHMNRLRACLWLNERRKSCWFLVVELCCCVVMFLFFIVSRQWASSSYRSTSPVRCTDRVCDCGERWVWVDGRVCGLMYVFCYYTAREDGMMGLDSGWDE